MASTPFSGQAPKQTFANILCCMCGISIPPNAANMCINCLRSQEDITAGITKEVILHQCRGCLRYNRNASWVVAQQESPQLLAVCLKKINGLQKVRLVNAEFIWTEPHSKRLKVNLTVQKEVLKNAKLQQEFVVEFVIRNQQCDECQRSYTAHTWKAIVQLRQKVDHKRTFLYLEQLIMKHGAHEKASNIEQKHNGMDFTYAERSGAAKFVDFLASVVPTRCKQAKQLVSQDFKSNVARFKYSYSVEIAPICKDDLLVLPKALAATLGCITPVTLVYQVTNFMRLVSPTTLQTAELTSSKYWRYEGLRPVMSAERMIEFTVLDCTPVVVTTSSSARSHGRKRRGRKKGRGVKRMSPSDSGDEADDDDNTSVMASTARVTNTGFGGAFGSGVGAGLGGMDRFKKRISGGMSVTSTVAGGPKGKFLLCEVDIARSSDMGVNDKTFTVKCHLGNILKAGDAVMGYDLTGCAFNDADLNGTELSDMPEIVLVRKCYPRRRAKKLPRPWQLKRLNAQIAEGEVERKDEVAKLARDMEMFMQDVEEDKFLRNTVPMYKDPQNIAALKQRAAAALSGRPIGGAGAGAASAAGAGTGAGAGAGAGAAADAGALDDDDSAGEEDFPEIPLDQLLDDMQLNDADADPDDDDDVEGAAPAAAATAALAPTTAGAAPATGDVDTMEDL